VIPNLREEYFSLAISGIEDIAFEANYIALIGQSHDELDREKKMVETMKKHRVDGLLVSISKNTTSLEHFEELQQFNIPVVYFDRVPDAPNIHSVWCSLYHSTLEAMEFLVKKGHKRIGFIQGPDTLNIKNERIQGYYAGLKKNKINPDDSIIATTDFSRESTQAAIDKMLSARSRPTAIIAFNDYVALDAMQYVRSKKLKINKDISFVSFANLPVTNYLETPPLASVEQFPYEQGSRAIEMLLKLIDLKEQDDSAPYENVVLESELIVH
jgi:DNA-binding LacI/PurR family transcriptional regulator